MQVRLVIAAFKLTISLNQGQNHDFNISKATTKIHSRLSISHTNRWKSNKRSVFPNNCILFHQLFSFFLWSSWPRAVSNMHF